MSINTDKRNGRLFVQFDYKGQTFKQYLPEGSTSRDALKLETKMRHDAFFQANGMAPRNEVLFDDAVQEYLGHIAGQPKYYRAELVLITAKPFLKGKLLRSIKPTDVERFMFDQMRRPTIHGKQRKTGSVWRDMAELSSFFTFCVKSDYLEYNPCSRVTKPKFNNIQDLKLEYEDEDDFLASFDAAEEGRTARDVCILVLNMGLSQNDALGLHDFQISRTRRELTLTRGKTKEHETLPINDAAWSIIEPRLGKGLLFRSVKTGVKLTSIKTAIAGACRRVNEERRKAELPEMRPIGIRDLRRTFGSRVEGEDHTVARLLCHRDTRMVIRYRRRTDKMRQAVDGLSNRPEKTTNPTPGLRIVNGRKD